MRLSILVFTIIFTWMPSKGFGNESFYKEKARGWHWYERKVKDNERLEDQGKVMTPSEQVEALRQETKEKLHKAMIEPTQDNVKEYIKSQKVIGDSSEEFSKMWMKVIYNNPELDPTVKNPTSEHALKISRTQTSQKKKDNIRAMSKEYGLIYFFRGDCEMCQGFASVVKGISEEYNWDVMAIRIGDKGHELFPDAKPDNGIAKRLKITHVPALLAVHPKTGEIVPLAYNYITEREIEERLNTIIGDR